MKSFPAQIFQRLAPSLSTPHCINWPTPLISIPRRVFRLNANDKGNHHNAKQCERYKAISFVGKMAIYTAHRAEVRSANSYYMWSTKVLPKLSPSFPSVVQKLC